MFLIFMKLKYQTTYVLEICIVHEEWKPYVFKQIT